MTLGEQAFSDAVAALDVAIEAVNIANGLGAIPPTASPLVGIANFADKVLDAHRGKIAADDVEQQVADGFAALRDDLQSKGILQT